MLKPISFLKESLTELLFPKVCSLCGMPLSGKQQFICGECIRYKFEHAELSKEELLNIPEDVDGRIALWQFDKGGYLQELLHDLKYNRLTGLGLDLGAALGMKIKLATNISEDEVLLLPVPLHPKKRRKRGYNQSYYIAKGVQRVIKADIIPVKAVQRIRNTRTQTGFSLEQRRSNIEGAFVVNDTRVVEGKSILIIDDVFTTGATSFELAHMTKKAGASKIYIATVAQA